MALGGTDAHARLATRSRDDGYRDSFAVAFPGYAPLFRAFGLRVELDAPWDGQPEADAAALLAALRAGRTYTAVDAVASPVRFEYRGRRDGRVTVRMGERVVGPGPIELRAWVTAPDSAELVLMRNGDAIERVSGTTLAYRVPPRSETAAYRVEVYLPGAPGRPPVPWIVSNPIYVGAPTDRSVSAPPNTDDARALDTVGAWTAEQGTDAVGTVDVTDGAVRLQFALGDDPETYAAAVYAVPPGGLIENQVVMFEVEATRPMRVSFQLRLDGDSDDVRWRRSFYASPTRRTVRVAVGEVEPVSGDIAARPDLRQVESLMVVVDTVNTMPGSRGVPADRAAAAGATVAAVRCEQSGGSSPPRPRTAHSGPTPPRPARGRLRCRRRRRRSRSPST